MRQAPPSPLNADRIPTNAKQRWPLDRYQAPTARSSAHSHAHEPRTCKHRKQPRQAKETAAPSLLLRRRSIQGNPHPRLQAVPPLRNTHAETVKGDLGGSVSPSQATRLCQGNPFSPATKQRACSFPTGTICAAGASRAAQQVQDSVRVQGIRATALPYLPRCESQILTMRGTTPSGSSSAAGSQSFSADAKRDTASAPEC
mmetsp:Transcript_10036/g.23928  ORF Transcript_10036/g.23928 Transcript_10036/m.23928 type:complete len:201 (+) Transcript_10036:778-1380(+)